MIYFANNAAHFSAQIHRFPRLLGGLSYIALGFSVLGDDIFKPPIVFLLIAGIVWPFFSFWLSCKKGTQQQEVINMKIDALFLGCACLILPNLMLVFSVMIILMSNALYTGSFGLLLKISTIFFGFTVPIYYILNIKFIEISKGNEIFIMLYLVIYFSIITMMMGKLIKEFLFLNKKAYRLSIKDSLTGSYNRFYLDQELPREINRCIRMKYPISVIFADIDFFKKINDKFGHGGGDKILKLFINILNSIIRKEFDWVARFGGEEFIIVLANSSTEEGVIIAEKMREKLSEYEFSIDGKKTHVTSSFGVTGIDYFNSTAPDAKKLLKAADKALYEAKESGRNRVIKNSVIV